MMMQVLSTYLHNELPAITVFMSDALTIYDAGQVCSVISHLHRTGGKLFQRDGPATAKLCWPIMVRALGTCSRPTVSDTDVASALFCS